MEERGGFVGEDARCDFDLMVQARMREYLEAGANRAGLGILTAIGQAIDARLDDRSSAHGTGLNRDIKRGSCQTVVAKRARSFAEDNHFGVGGGVAIANGAVAGPREDAARVQEDGADWNFTSGGSRAGLSESSLHQE